MTILIWIFLTPLLVVNLMFLAEMLMGLPRRPSAGHAPTVRDVVILVPAHDEALGIGDTIDRLKRVAASDFSTVVVADNCSDETAAISREQGVTVIERHDPKYRGKGYALAFAREWMRHSPPAAVLVLDADCRIDGLSLRHLAGRCLVTNAPCQAVNLLEPNRREGPLVQISTFAFLIKNLVRQRGLMRLTGSVHLTGTGMCLPWALFERADLATSSIVEDLRLGIELSRAGAHTQLVENSYVWSPHAALGDTLTQRGRWEGGFLSIARGVAPATIANGLKVFNLPSILRGLDLLVPPLALLAIVNAGIFLLTGLVAASGWSGWGPAVALLTTEMLMATAIILAWWREGRDFLSVEALVRLPLYALWKVPMYMGLAKKGAPSEWRRTGRTSEKDREA